MTPCQQEITNNYKKSLKQWFEILLTMDADFPLQEQVYNTSDIANATFLFQHVVGNYVIGEMLKQGCSKEYIEKSMTDMWEALREYLLEYAKLDSFTFPDL